MSDTRPFEGVLDLAHPTADPGLDGDLYPTGQLATRTFAEGAPAGAPDEPWEVKPDFHALDGELAQELCDEAEKLRLARDAASRLVDRVQERANEDARDPALNVFVPALIPSTTLDAFFVRAARISQSRPQTKATVWFIKLSTGELVRLHVEVLPP